MEIKSVFRKMFWLRFAIGIFIFMMLSIHIVTKVFIEKTYGQASVIISFVLVLFLLYSFSDFTKNFSMRVTEIGIERTFLVYRNTDFIYFDSIESLETKKVRHRNARGNISDGFNASFVKLKDGKSFIISADSYANYKEIILFIRDRINQ